MGTVDHVALELAPDGDHPDELRVDLDPTPGSSRELLAPIAHQGPPGKKCRLQ